MNDVYDVVIVGGGIIGASTLYVLSKYTGVKKVALLEKYPALALVSSHRKNNSQTLHFGDIETNYSLEKAGKVKDAASLVANYMKSQKKGLYRKSHKMVLAVGEKQVKELEERTEEFRKIFPSIKRVGREDLLKLEPYVVKDRPRGEKVLAMASDDGYIVDFGAVTKSFVENAVKSNKSARVVLGVEVKSVEKKAHYVLHTSKGEFRAKVVVFATGPYSLVFARQLGYGGGLGVLPVAGNFYLSPGVLNGKVYTMQIKGIPFAAVHGDPDVSNPAETRFGPVAKVLPMFERGKYNSVFDFFRTSLFSFGGVVSFVRIMSDSVMIKYALKSLLYELPLVGKHFFLRWEVKRIIPSMTAKDLTLARGYGAVRPQVVDIRKGRMSLGEAKIVGKNIIFDITPSPGASVSLQNAEFNAKKIAGFLKAEFDQKGFDKDLR